MTTPHTKHTHAESGVFTPDTATAVPAPAPINKPGTQDVTTIVLLPVDRQEPGETVSIPSGDFGFAVTVHDVLYVHVDTTDDGVWRFIPLNAK